MKKTRSKCRKGFKQKSGIVRHLKQVHGKSFGFPKLKVLETSEMEFESSADYGLHQEERTLEVQEVEKIVDEYGEVAVLEYVCSRGFGRVH